MASTEFIASSWKHIYGQNADYATARATSTGEASTWNVYIGQTSGPTIWRGFLSFDTSSLAGNTVTQANLEVGMYVGGNAAGFDLQIVKCNWGGLTREEAYDLALSASSDDSILGTTILSGTVTSGNLDPTWVNTSGTTYYALRTSLDFAGTNANKQAAIFSTGTSHGYVPYLKIVYTEGGGGSSTPIHLIRTGMQPGMRIGL